MSAERPAEQSAGRAPSRPGGRSTVLLAPDKLKGSATAVEVTAAVAEGLHQVTDADVVACPVADGGDGTVDVLLTAGYRRLVVEVVDALGEPVAADVAVRDGTAVVELARVCGLAALGGRREPWRAGTRGLGLALAAVVDAGYRDVVIGLGGSASTDGGLGLLLGLGARVLDASGRPVPPDASGLGVAEVLELGPVRLPDGVRLRIAADVDAPLHGPDGAAAQFGPQKGATPPDVRALDVALARWGALLAHATGRPVAELPGAGAAGGTGAALLALGAEVALGADLVLDAVGFDDHLRRARLVVTGEGRWDRQSVRGKAPGEVVARARAAGVPFAVVAGQVAPDAVPEGAGLVHDLSRAAGGVGPATADVHRWLVDAGRVVGELVRRLPGNETEEST